jgi:hypothetical protein
MGWKPDHFQQQSFSGVGAIENSYHVMFYSMLWHIYLYHLVSFWFIFYPPFLNKPNGPSFFGNQPWFIMFVWGAPLQLFYFGAHLQIPSALLDHSAEVCEIIHPTNITGWCWPIVSWFVTRIDIPLTPINHRYHPLSYAALNFQPI